MKHMIAATLSITAILAGPLALADTENKPPQETPIMAQSQHAAWSKLLSKYVTVSDDGINRLDYDALKKNAADRKTLDTYIASFEATDFDAFTTAEKIATWSNIYNAVTVRYIVGEYPTKSIRSGLFSAGPWKKVKTMAGGQNISLNDIEHDVLRNLDDPRIHYAINCASYSCPNLLPKALDANTLDKVLDKAASDYINNPRGVTVTDRGLVVSEIYNWFEEDFGGSKSAVIDHLLEYADADLKAQIEANPTIRKYDYDWSLNDVE